jgi:hypothetical protein
MRAFLSTYAPKNRIGPEPRQQLSAGRPQNQQRAPSVHDTADARNRTNLTTHVLLHLPQGQLGQGSIKFGLCSWQELSNDLVAPIFLQKSAAPMGGRPFREERPALIRRLLTPSTQLQRYAQPPPLYGTGRLSGLALTFLCSTGRILFSFHLNLRQQFDN